ncbi:V-type ATPase subunit, partial [candidate division WOR-3 bacterium]|nr:V-type ATPase subunit [candidate division WOR-3 bacterium]
MFKDYAINDDPYYLYICALLTEREKEFIDKQRWERLINADSTKDFLKVLQETHYSKYTNMIEKTGNLESAMTEEHTSIMNLLRGFLKKEHEPLKEFYLLRLDMQNIKIIMKASITEKDFSDIFHAFSYSYQDLKEAYESGKYDKIDKETQEILNYAKHTIDLEKNQRTRELLLERFYLNKMYEHFSSIGSEMLIDLLKHTIDMYNIKNIYR